MRLLKAEILFLLVFVIDYIRTELDPDGKNVCLTTENYTETVIVQVEKKKTVKKWCWKIRCSRTKLVYEDEPRVFKRTRIVAKCCDGYKEEIGQTDCVPACLKGCKNGKCTAPDTCACDPGFHGQECDKECPEGYWGVNCVNKCACSENEKCSRGKGCECKPGWMGDRCDLPCQEGYYGYSCEKKCNCDLACNHETGECITSTFPPLAATKYVAWTSTNGYQATEIKESSVSEVTDKNAISSSEGSVTNETSATEISGRLETEMFTEVDETTGPTFGKTIKADGDEVSSETAATKDTKLLHSVTSMIEQTQTTEVAIASDPFPKAITEPSATDITSEKSSEETTQKDKEIKHHMQNEINFFEGLVTVVKNASIKETEATEYSTEVSAGDILDEFLTNNTTFWITFTKAHPDTDETDNLISSEKGSAPKDYLHTKFHFFASLSILSTISFIICIIAAGWIIVSHRRKVQKIMVTKQKEKVIHAEQGKIQTQNFLWVNGCVENPVYLSDIDINKAVPILQTFKPVN